MDMFSITLQDPVFLSLIQDKVLERTFHDALFPKLMFRSEVDAEPWPDIQSTTHVFSSPGLLPVDLRPRPAPSMMGDPDADLKPKSYGVEQWQATLHKHADTMDTHMPSSVSGVCNLFLQNIGRLGLQSGQVINRLVRNTFYRGGLSGNTNLAAPALAGATELSVMRLNGLTHARNPGFAGASSVAFGQVSNTNPLKVKIGTKTYSIIGYTPTYTQDLVGPGTITITPPLAEDHPARDPVQAVDATKVFRPKAQNSVDGLTSTDLPTLANVRDIVGAFWQQNVPVHGDGRFHCHTDASSEGKLLSDVEFQRMLTGVPNHIAYTENTVGQIINTIFYRNSECPLPETVYNTNFQYDVMDPFPGELKNKTDTTIHRMLFTGGGACKEYYQTDPVPMSPAGFSGKVAPMPTVTQNSVTIKSERVSIIFRAPTDKLQEYVSSSWKFVADWVCRTDASVGNPCRYKRVAVLEHGE